MSIKSEYRRQVRQIENTWIPMRDGARLAARIWLPDDAERDPVPGLLEYLPYRKDDGTAARDAIRHPYFAGHGYASIRVDMRGSGDSDGVLYDEYLPQEQEDALDVLRWIAAQPWCTGAVGMFGISWGGFNALQVAAHRPPELKAVITLCSTDDRYADDVHYMGGCVLACEMLSWASNMLADNASPPHPHLAGDRWREMWFERMENSPPFVETWLRHQRRDAYWKQGSVCESFADITCPVYAVGGWADAYTNAIPRLLAGLTCPRKGLIGPWAHNYPNAGRPGPAIGFQQECLRWWDHWLKGEDTGIMSEPMLRAWMQASVPPAAGYAELPGRWVSEPAWPSPHIGESSLWLNAPGELAGESAEEQPVECAGTLAHGQDAGVWCPYGANGDFPLDQRAEDGRSLCFTSAPLEEPQEILGYPEVTLTLSADRPRALVAVRLCDVRPDGSSLLVSRGLLNLTHRPDHETPERLEPGRRYTVSVRLNVAGHSMPAGHHWRVAVSPDYWPWAWPSPEPVTLTLCTGEGCRLALPVRAPRLEDADLPPFEGAEGAAPLTSKMLRAGSRSITVERDVLSGRLRWFESAQSSLHRQAVSKIEYGGSSSTEYRVVEGDPLSAAVRCERSVTVGRGDWQTRVETVSTMTADADAFHVTNALDAYEGDQRVFAKTWSATIARDGV